MRIYMKHWCFTVNNYVKADAKQLSKQVDDLQYLVLGREIGETGTPHIQGYVVFKKRKRLTAVRKIIPRGHWTAKYKTSTPQQCIQYCKKDGDFMEHGIAPLTNSERMKDRWSEAYEDALSGNFQDIPKDMLVRYYHAFKRIRQDNPPQPDDLKSLRNLWIIAPTGYGKSHYARKTYGPKSNLYDKSPNKWWVGYKGEENILCDDFGPKQCLYLGWYIKRWADLYTFPMETKGGGTVIRPKRIIVTSNYTIEECFKDELECKAVQRRFKVFNLPHWKHIIKF